VTSTVILARYRYRYVFKNVEQIVKDEKITVGSRYRSTNFFLPVGTGTANVA